MTSPKKRVPKKQRVKITFAGGATQFAAPTKEELRREKRMERLTKGYVDKCTNDWCNRVSWCVDIPDGATMMSVAFEGNVGPLLHRTMKFFSRGMRVAPGDDDSWIDLFVPLPTSPTWHDLWVACDYAIHASGDLHHTFIEAFEKHDGYIVVLLGS